MQQSSLWNDPPPAQNYEGSDSSKRENYLDPSFSDMRESAHQEMLVDIKAVPLEEPGKVSEVCKSGT